MKSGETTQEQNHSDESSKPKSVNISKSENVKKPSKETDNKQKETTFVLF